MPIRSFTTMDLLIGLVDMPSGWVSYEPFTPDDRECVGKDCATIRFDAETDAARRRAYQTVYRYRSQRAAQEVYEELIAPGVFGQVPPDWDYKSPLADQSNFACYDYEGREPPICKWAGRYEEYVVVFRSWLIPERMSSEDFEAVVRAIDERMAQYLRNRPPSTQIGGR